MDWTNIAILLLGFLSGAALVGWFYCWSNERLLRGLTLMHEANNDFISKAIVLLEKERKQKPTGES